MITRIETDRLVLRPFVENDAAVASINSKQPLVAHFMSDMVLVDEEAARKWITWINQRLNDTEPFQVLAIERKEDAQVIGLIGMAPKKEINNEVEILFAIADAYQSQGYATEAGKAFLQWAFEEVRMEALAAIVKPVNKASRRVIEKLGFLYGDTRVLPYDGDDCAFDYFRLVHKGENSDSVVEHFYQFQYNEDDRMNRNALEFTRCKEIISRYLDKKEMEIADIGGATGIFSFWLAAQHHHVHLLDLTPSHIEQAKENSRKLKLSLASYHCSDARNLPYEDHSFDMVLLMGPLYHLQNRNDRLKCLSEAHRVLKDTGILLCEVISRFASLVDGFKYSYVEDEKFVAILEADLATGRHTPGDSPYFTTSFFHTPDELENELVTSGFTDIETIAVEGFANALDGDKILSDEKLGPLLLNYIRKTESIPGLMGISGHFFAVAKKPT